MAFSSSSWHRRATVRTKAQESSLCIAFSNDNRTIVSGSFDGTITGYDTFKTSIKFHADTSLVDASDASVASPKRAGSIPSVNSVPRYPVTAVQFRPGTDDILLVGCSSGMVVHWDTKKQQVLRKAFESENDIYTIAYHPRGASYCTAGRDGILRLYDESTGNLMGQFFKGQTNESIVNAHRVYSVKWADSNTVLTGGWNNTVCVWDMRSRGYGGSAKEVFRTPVRTMFGPYLCGEGLDVQEQKVVTASHRVDQPVELWDLASGERIMAYEWPPRRVDSDATSVPNTMPMSASFCSDGTLVAVGGCGGIGLTNQALILESHTGKCTFECPTEKGVNSVAFGHQDINTLAFADGSGRVHIYEHQMEVV